MNHFQALWSLCLLFHERPFFSLLTEDLGMGEMAPFLQELETDCRNVKKDTYLYLREDQFLSHSLFPIMGIDLAYGLSEYRFFHLHYQGKEDY